MAAADQPLGYAGMDDTEAVRAAHRGAELGVTLLDTADAYGAGHSERLLAGVLAVHPDVLVATKFGTTFDESTRQLTGVDTTPAYVRAAVRASLRRLGRDRIDLYQLHTPDVPPARAAELVGTLEELVTEGLIAWYGVSTDTPDHARAIAAGPHCTAVQLELNVLDDNTAMLDLCDELDLAALCRSPLAMGLLGGRYTAASRIAASDIRGTPPEWLRWFDGGRPRADYLERLVTVREELMSGGRTLAQGALAWIWARHERAIPLPGFRDSGQVEDNAGALRQGALEPAAMAAIGETLGRTVTVTP
jgi:aryl-alcohol dehydrogenase-like predicted oxidoreductase